MDREYLIAGYWYRSELLRRGHVRATVTPILGLLVLSALACLYVFYDLPAEARPALVVLLLLGLALIGLYWSIVLFNRPRFLVAPHYRDEPGAWRERGR